MKKILFFTLCSFVVTAKLFSQIQAAENNLKYNEVIYYYDDEWEETSKNYATFYRIFAKNQNDEPVGEIRDYFASGVLQGKADGAIEINRSDDSESIWIGNIYVYHENGEPSLERYHDEYGQIHGTVRKYDENGDLNDIYSYYHGVRGFNFWKCTDFMCEYKYSNDFTDDDQISNDGWPLYEDDQGEYYIGYVGDDEDDLRYIIDKENGSSENTTIGIFLPLDKSNSNFKVESHLEWFSDTDAVDDSYYGILLGYKDWDNYISFNISHDNYFSVDIVKKGVQLGMTEWQPFEGEIDNNYLSIIRLDKELIFSIDNRAVFTSDNQISLMGDYFGFNVSGKIKVTFDDIEITESVEKE